MALDLNDKTASGFNLTNNGAIEYTTDFPFVDSTEAVKTDNSGGDEYLSNNNAILDPTTDFTIEFWVKLVNEIGSGTWEFLHLENNTKKYVIYMKYEYNGGTRRLSFAVDRWVIAGGNPTYNITLGTSSWTHVGLVRSGNTLYIYVNGSQVASASFTETANGDTATNNQVLLGLGTTVGTSTLINKSQAILDDIRLWQVARTTTEINNNKSLELLGNETNLKAYWPLESLGSPSSSLSPSASRSPSSSVSPSISPSASRSPSASVSPSISPSASVSPSASLSPSASTSPSISPSASLSPSASASPSPSASLSPSASGSPSVSPSSSASPSISPSASLSPSASISASVSPSGSRSPSSSASLSLSPSASISASPSPTPSPSISPSSSISASLSPSHSVSPSPSPFDVIYVDKYTENNPTYVKKYFSKSQKNN